MPWAPEESSGLATFWLSSLLVFRTQRLIIEYRLVRWVDTLALNVPES